MSRPESGVARLISQLSLQTSSPKVRTYGRVLAVDALASVVLLAHDSAGVLVDLSLCLAGGQHLPAVKDVIGVIGYVEERGDREEPAVELAYKPEFVLRNDLCLAAVLMLPASDLELWTRATVAGQSATELPVVNS